VTGTLPHLPTSLDDFRDAVVSTIQAAMPGVDVAGHNGAFGEKDIQIFGAKAPAVRVAVLGWSLEELNAVGIVVPVKCSAVLVTADAKADDGKILPRDRAQLVLGTQLAILLNSSRFGFNLTKQPAQVKGENRYEASFFAKGLALMEVTWTSKTTFGVQAAQQLGALAQVYVNGTLLLDPADTGADVPLAPPNAPFTPPEGS